MAFSINTNIASMQAQDYLRATSEFQSKTINRVTSGLRIVSSGDDAAGLAIANAFRSDQAVLSQGIRNANDGLATLQTIDGGVSNISKLLDRARTLAAQSASGTYSGSRTVLNSEFQSVMSEIDRQAQAIGLDKGGTFAKNLSVFIGGGRANSSTSEIGNGSVAVDLRASTVDTRSLGLKGTPAVNSTDYDLSTGTSAVGNLIATNSTGTAKFYFAGPGFGDGSRIAVSINTTGIDSTDELVTALNTAIVNAGNAGTAAATAFKNAGVQAQIVTNSDGEQKLSFTSPSAAFVVSSGDATANALMGNLDTDGVTATAITSSVTGAVAMAAAGAATDINLEITGGALGSAITIAGIDLTADASRSDMVDTVQAAIDLAAASNAELAKLDLTVSVGTGNKLVFTSSVGDKFQVKASGDIGATNYLGMGGFITGASDAVSYDTITSAGFTTAAADDDNVVDFYVSLDGGASQHVQITLAGSEDSDGVAQLINAQIAGNATLAAAGIVADDNGGQLRISSSNGTKFQLASDTGASSGTDTFVSGFGTATTLTDFTANTVSAAPATAQTFLTGGVYQSSQFTYSDIVYGSDSQTVSFAANNASGVRQSLTVTLDNDNGGDLSQAISTINDALQASNNPTLQNLVAFKVNVAGVEKLQFASGAGDFTVSFGSNPNAVGLKSGTSQDVTDDATLATGGQTVDIGTEAGAQDAVNKLGSAVSNLGDAQAVVGRAQNQFSFAVSLASTQLTNLAASESRIRDADLASEAANLTKAQILSQAGVAAMAQANSAPQAILSLLRG